MKRPIVAPRNADEAVAILDQLANEQNLHVLRRRTMTRKVANWIREREAECADIQHGAVSLIADAAQRVGEARRAGQAKTT